MQYCGNKARVFVAGKWSPFMPINDAVKFQHDCKVRRFLAMLRAGKHVIGLSDDVPAMHAAQEAYKKERESVVTTLTQNAD
jgi:hypothetical protein